MNMRAKVRVSSVVSHGSCESLTFNPVAKPLYDETGLDEDNTYAHYSPGGEFRLTVANPALLGKFVVGETYYVDFTKA